LSRSPRPSAEDLKALDPNGSFRDRLEADRASIAQLSEGGDIERLRRIVHALAGAAGTFGFAAIGDIAIELDNRFIAGHPVMAVDVARLLAALEQTLGKPEKSA
jgi:HPt (histidine-containing phosphotransfer) domain-containing protein